MLHEELFDAFGTSVSGGGAVCYFTGRCFRWKSSDDITQDPGAVDRSFCDWILGLELYRKRPLKPQRERLWLQKTMALIRIPIVLVLREWELPCFFWTLQNESALGLLNGNGDLFIPLHHRSSIRPWILKSCFPHKITADNNAGTSRCPFLYPSTMTGMDMTVLSLEGREDHLSRPLELD